MPLQESDASNKARARASLIRLRHLDGDEWDKFAQRCGGSFLCSSAVLRLYGLYGRVIAMAFLLDNRDGSVGKIGQCAIVRIGSRRQFLDSVVLEPAHADRWAECFRLAIGAAGPGFYRYGSNWNVESDLAGRIFSNSGIIPVSGPVGYMEVFECGRWPSFDAYMRDVSQNVRRDLAIMRKLDEPATIERCSGLAALRVIHHLSILRRAVLTRYNHRITFAVDYVRHVLKVILFRRYVYVTLVRQGGSVKGMFLGTAFGPTLHYNSGATHRDMKGLGAYLFVHVLRDWFDRFPDGRVVFGLVDGEPEKHPSSFRHKLRARPLGGGPLEFTVATTVDWSSAPSSIPLDGNPVFPRPRRREST